jgi:hypothetical protein
MQTNALRGILYEFGIVLPAGYPALTKAWAALWRRHPNDCQKCWL